jgi:4-hydroxybenzoate polyprenyltransferase
MSAFAAVLERTKRYGRLVAFTHSIFALPFALQGAWIADRAAPKPAVLAGIVLAAVFARTAAMGTNRIVDRELDARNPRTAGRELPAGRVSVRAAWTLVLACSAAFVATAFALGPLCGALSPFVLAVLFLYSWTKRVTWWCHAVLGLSLALAPPAAWLAVRGAIDGGAVLPLLLSGAVLTWVAGFDVIYACQDAEFDRAERLHSVPARFGVARALRVARLSHVATVACLALFAWRADLGAIYWAAILLAALLLVAEHAVVRPDDLSRVNLAFFTFNGWVGVGLFAGLVLDLAR